MKICIHKIVLIVLLITASFAADSKPVFAVQNDSVIQFVFCSDLHFGLTKPVFRDKVNVSSAVVNAAMVAKMNELPLLNLPNDNGIAAGKKIKGIAAVIITGDICNRQEKDIQSASVSWKQFEEDYIDHLQLKDSKGNKTKLLLTPGNHDISNAVGFHRPMQPLTDKASMIGMYNLMIEPAVLKTENTYDFSTDKIHYSKNIGGIHFIFVDAWPDSAERVWMEKDLRSVSGSTPVFLFTHSMPDVEARFFVNPDGDHSINEKDKFENLVTETFKDGSSVEDKAIMEQKAFAAFIQQHQNIKAYFHGHTNYTEYYNWKGPDQNISLPCFRTDSPMKGRYSAKDETKLAFELISIDTVKKMMTVRECLWNANPAVPTAAVTWGISINSVL